MIIYKKDQVVAFAQYQLDTSTFYRKMVIGF